MNTSDSRTAWIIYTFPTLMDVSGGGIGFASLVQAAELKASNIVVGMLGSAVSASYLVTCFIVGRFVTPGNSAAFIVAGCAGTLAVSVLLSLVSTVPQMFPLMMFAGVSLALFFVSFQVFMKAVDTGRKRPIAYSAGTYTFAWSVGYAIGPLVGGFLKQLSGAEPGAPCVYCYAVCGGLALVTMAGTLIFRHHAAPVAQDSAPGSETPYARMPDLAWVGWVASGIGVMIFNIIMRIFPKEATDLQWRDDRKGLVLFLMCITLALVAFALRRTRSWMYDWRRICAFGLFGIAGMIILSLGDSLLAACLGAVSFGVYAGAFFFYLVFHALSHPSRSARYVSINEAVVGTASMLGPLWAGALADLYSFDVVYVCGAVLIVAALVFQALVHRRRVRSVPE
ncbi:MAG: MFS transporter [Planctomycetes bacterium]|nr:MFS transporter [Planctomycetota bacterium]